MTTYLEYLLSLIHILKGEDIKNMKFEVEEDEFTVVICIPISKNAQLEL